METNININDYVECLLMKEKLVTFKDGVISGDGFVCDLPESEGEYNGEWVCHVFQEECYYTVAMINDNKEILVVHAGRVDE